MTPVFPVGLPTTFNTPSSAVSVQDVSSKRTFLIGCSGLAIGWAIDFANNSGGPWIPQVLSGVGDARIEVDSNFTHFRCRRVNTKLPGEAAVTASCTIMVSASPSEAAVPMGDSTISRDITTTDATPTPIYTFTTPTADGEYTVQVNIVASKPGAEGCQAWAQACWKVVAGVLTDDGAPVIPSVQGALAIGGVSQDVTGGVGRLLVTGIAATRITWRMKGVTFDNTNT